MKKKKKECAKKPYAVGHPEVEAVVKSPPNKRCVNLKVSGFATRKKTSVE